VRRDRFAVGVAVNTLQSSLAVCVDLFACLDTVTTLLSGVVKPRLHDTTELTTVLNEQLFVQPVVKPGCTTDLTTGLTTGCIVYTNIYPVVKPVLQ